MLLQPYQVEDSTLVTDIVSADYRTAAVFQKHGIEYCCGGKWPLSTACMIKGMDTTGIKSELAQAVRNMRVNTAAIYPEWNTDFLVSFISNVHHRYIKNNLPGLRQTLIHFIGEHHKKYPALKEAETVFLEWETAMYNRLEQEENVLFPYILQIAHAYEGKESYAGLLVRTLRKPMDYLENGQDELVSFLQSMRKLTDNYTPPVRACISHRVSFSRLRELDEDMVQYMYLRNHILFPRIRKMEKELREKD